MKREALSAEVQQRLDSKGLAAAGEGVLQIPITK